MFKTYEQIDLSKWPKELTRFLLAVNKVRLKDLNEDTIKDSAGDTGRGTEEKVEPKKLDSPRAAEGTEKSGPNGMLTRQTINGSYYYEIL